MEGGSRSLRDVIREGREIKRRAREQQIDIRGRLKAPLEQEMKEKVQGILRDAIRDNQQWLQRELERVAQHYGVSAQVASRSFLKGLRTAFEGRIKLTARVCNIPLEEILRDDEKLAAIFQQTMFDFFRAVRNAMRRRNTLRQTLAFSTWSHWIDPHELERLRACYRDIPPSVVTEALVLRPRNPEGHIKDYLHRVEALKRIFPDVPDGTIRYAAEHYPRKAEAFLHHFLQQRKELIRAYQGIPLVTNHVIESALRASPKQPRKFINSFLHNMKRLRRKYGHILPEGVIKCASLSSMRNPEGFIEDYLKRLEAIRSHFPHFTPHTIHKIALRRTRNYLAFARRYDQQVKEMRHLYGSRLGDAFLRSLVLNHPRHPRKAVERFLQSVARLSEEYGDHPLVDPFVIKWAAMRHTKDPAHFLAQYVERLKHLQARYGRKVSLKILKIAALRYPRRAEAFVRWYCEMERRLLEDNPQRKRMFVRECLLKHPFAPFEELTELV